MIDYEKKFEEENKHTITGRSLGEYYQRFKFWLYCQLQDKDTEIESQSKKIYALNARVSHRGKENLNITRLARKSSETIEQLREEIAELKIENEAESKRAKDNFDTAIKFRDGPKGMVAYSEMAGKLQQRTKERDNHFRDIIKLENELSELEALKAKIAKGIPVDIAYTGSTNIITNLPNALYGKFILLGLNEMEDDDD